MKSLLLVFILFTLSSFGDTYSQAVKEKKIYPMGKKIYFKKCKKIYPNAYSDITKLKEYIKNSNICENISDKYIDYVSLYLFEMQKNKLSQNNEDINISKKEKCPICGMFIYKYPKWATQIYYQNIHYSFDGVKDMMKYYFKHQNMITNMLVRDYYSQKVYKANECFYVIGSDIYGPMGNEFIAFKNKKDASVFYMDHRGKKIIKFSDITQDMVYQLDK